MQDNLYLWEDRALRQLCVPASHDSSMSKLVWSTLSASNAIVRTQSKSVEEQLALGVRYFDLRPVLHKDRWICGHYSYISAMGSWQGGDGETIQEIVEGINRFTSKYQELVVLHVSHVYRLHDRPGQPFFEDDFVGPTKDEWKNLLDVFNGLQYRWDQKADDLTKKTLRDFIGAGKSAVLLIFDDSVDVSDWAGMFHALGRVRLGGTRRRVFAGIPKPSIKG